MKEGRIQLSKKLVIPAEAGIQVLFPRSWIPVFTGMATWVEQQENLFKELKFCNLMNSKGISVVFLVIAMLLMVAIGYVFSYLIPAKQKSVVFPIQSTQAFFIAQSGVEFAVRYATVQGWTTTAQLNGLDAMTRNLGAGRFVLGYDPANNTLYSWGEVPTGTERRRINVSNFTQFLQTLILTAPAPCLALNDVVQFNIINNGTLPVVIDSFSGHWENTPRHLDRLYMDGTLKFSGRYDSDDPRTYFNRNPNPPNSTYTINPGDTITVLLDNSGNFRNSRNVTVVFYDTAGKAYSFVLIIGSLAFPRC